MVEKKKERIPLQMGGKGWRSPSRRKISHFEILEPQGQMARGRGRVSYRGRNNRTLKSQRKGDERKKGKKRKSSVG